MRKYPYKVIAMASLLTMATVNVGPSIQAYAQEQTITVKQKQEHLKLAPEQILKESLVKSSSNALTMQIYARTILGQSDINLANIDLGSDSNLQTKLTNHQKSAREHAQFWENTLQKQIIRTNQAVISYDNRFQEYYNSLISAIDDQDKSEIKRQINSLRRSIQSNQKTVGEVIDQLKGFQTKLNTDKQNFQTDGEKVITILAGKDSVIGVLEKQITGYNDAIHKHMNYLIGGSVAIGLSLGIGGLAIGLAVVSGGILVPVILGGGALALLAGSGYLAYENYDAMNNAKKGLQDTTQQLTAARAAVNVLTAAKSSVNAMSDAVEKAIPALQNIKTQWETMDAKYETLVEDVDWMNPEQLKGLKVDLDVAKSSWDDLKTWAEKIQGDLSGLNLETKKLQNKVIQ
ncbi:hypothetical protein BM86_23705 [Bacillus thuringiensis]|uniref:Hemolysin BL-binding component HblA n=1 Tax=Bacillus thuringiensis TaxID=1428 RepID=A0A9W3SJ90_BACTU|nr:HBL/NHE enterotoxin family protein [Bacillus thuringiensis]ANS52209.1 hemolysin BL-binding component HblA [Bacillus thuringiensis]MBH0338416.1 hypothetical protein [Bacillus thuringiensis]